MTVEKLKFLQFYSTKLPKFLQKIIICFQHYQNFIIQNLTFLSFWDPELLHLKKSKEIL